MSNVELRGIVHSEILRWFSDHHDVLNAFIIRLTDSIAPVMTDMLRHHLLRQLEAVEPTEREQLADAVEATRKALQVLVGRNDQERQHASEAIDKLLSLACRLGGLVTPSDELLADVRKEKEVAF
jgi:hypothetical protein